MKICGIICEYNPFHNGHAYLIEKARRESGCDALVCVMSGNFTQRGEIALLDKYTRARHAVHAGADAVLELPTVFAISPAELFAKGGVKILSALPGFSVLAFGAENSDKYLFYSAARETAEESPARKIALREHLRAGVSLTKARAEALAQTGRANLADFLRTPNNILGVEYQKAINFFQSAATIMPIPRKGAGHADKEPHAEFSSATAIRAAVRTENRAAVEHSVPSFVRKDLNDFSVEGQFKKLQHFAAIRADREDLKKIVDCTEGLENRIQAVAKQSDNCDELIAKATTKRYISSRIRRILTAAVLGISKKIVFSALQAPLYLKLLALRGSRAEELLSALGKSSFPLLARQNDANRLNETAKETFAIDALACEIFRLCASKKTTESLLPIVDEI